jgi:ABC-type transport system involved in multi-copper enzyme maturation permease subunit
MASRQTENRAVARLIVADWQRFSRRLLNQAALLLLVLAVAWHFRGDYRQAQEQRLLDNQAAELQRLRLMPSGELSSLSDPEQRRWFTAQQVALELPGSLGVALWVWGGARAVWLLLAILAVGGEFQWGTARWLLSLGPGRVRWLLAKVLCLLLTALATVLILWLAVVLAGLYVHVRAFGALAWDWAMPRFWAGQMMLMLRAWLGFWPWIGLGVLLGMVSRSSVAGAALAALGVVVESLWAYLLMILSAMGQYSGVAVPRWLLPEGLLGQLYRWTIGYNVASLLLWAGDQETVALAMGRSIDPGLATVMLTELPTTPERALAVALGYALLAVGLAAWLLARRDLAR